MLGPSYQNGPIRAVLDGVRACYHTFEEEALLDRVVTAMVEGKTIGWFHGRAEFGPRALGARSIIADARNPETQSILNLNIKYRESFRPFAPCVPRDHVHEWFAMRPDEDSPYMLQVAPVVDGQRLSLSPEDQETLQSDPDLARRVKIPRSTVPAITHVNYSARVQTIDGRHG